MEELVENLKLAEEELQGKIFFKGDKIGVADLAFGWLANLMSVFEQVTGFKNGSTGLVVKWCVKMLVVLSLSPTVRQGVFYFAASVVR
ncbi:hypothetical protein Golob_005862, partial [Gossypium lobatum]|nr:hypothetical protein [Gossypium lobatum]